MNNIRRHNKNNAAVIAASVLKGAAHDEGKLGYSNTVCDNPEWL